MSRIPKDLLVFDIEDILQNGSGQITNGHIESLVTLIRRLESKLNQISNFLRMDGASCDIYCGADYLHMIQDMLVGNAATMKNMSNPDFIGQLSGVPIYRDFTLDKVIEFRKGNEVMATLNLRDKQKVRRDKLDNLLNKKDDRDGRDEV